MSKVSEALGMTQTKYLDGFKRNERAGAMPTCTRCGALVAFETQKLHLAWHEEQQLHWEKTPGTVQ